MCWSTKSLTSFMLLSEGTSSYSNGLPGDTLVLTGSTVTVDGVILKEPYISSPQNFTGKTITVPPNDYFVMGDNRPDSDDSRDWGILPRDNIIGKAVMVYWPFSSWQLINTYPSVYDKIKSSS